MFALHPIQAIEFPPLIPTVYASPIEQNEPETATSTILRIFGLKDGKDALKVANCESKMRQFVGTSTEVTKGKIDPDDTGLFQINLRWHRSFLKKHPEFDVLTLEGNTEYAKFLYDENGGWTPWKSSNSCHHLLD